MKHKVIISKKNGIFPLKGLNQVLDGRIRNPRTKKYHNPVKADNDKTCCMAIRKCMRGVKIENPIKCIYYVYAKDKMHDRGNLYAAVEKSFLDALQKENVIKNDGWNDVLDSEFHTFIDKENPRIIVEVIEVEKQ